MDDLQFILIDPKKDICDYWVEAINNIPVSIRKFKVINGVIGDVGNDVQIDCFVSPANSYARLDGAYDYVLSEIFCPENVRAVTQYCQAYLHQVYQGYLHPGSSLIIPMHEFDEKKFKARYLALTPTMKTPSRITNTQGLIYDCMWSLLSSIYRHNAKSPSKIKSVCITGLGTGVGQYSTKHCAQEMILAFKHFMETISNPWQEVSWKDISSRQWDLDEILRSSK